MIRYYLDGTVVTSDGDEKDIQEEYMPGAWRPCPMREEEPPEKLVSSRSTSTLKKDDKEDTKK